MLLKLSVLRLLTLSAVHGGGLFGGIGNCRHSKCYIKVGSVTVGSWSEKHCGHSCGTMQRLTPSLCRSRIGNRASDQAVCNSNTFRYGSGSGDKRLVSWFGFQSGTIHKGFSQKNLQNFGPPDQCLKLLKLICIEECIQVLSLHLHWGQSPFSHRDYLEFQWAQFGFQITATLTGKPDCRDGRDPNHWMNGQRPLPVIKKTCCLKAGNSYFGAPAAFC